MITINIPEKTDIYAFDESENFFLLSEPIYDEKTDNCSEKYHLYSKSAEKILADKNLDDFVSRFEILNSAIVSQKHYYLIKDADSVYITQINIDDGFMAYDPVFITKDNSIAVGMTQIDVDNKNNIIAHIGADSFYIIPDEKKADKIANAEYTSNAFRVLENITFGGKTLSLFHIGTKETACDKLWNVFCGNNDYMYAESLVLGSLYDENNAVVVNCGAKQALFYIGKIKDKLYYGVIDSDVNVKIPDDGIYGKVEEQYTTTLYEYDIPSKKSAVIPLQFDDIIGVKNEKLYYLYKNKLRSLDGTSAIELPENKHCRFVGKYVFFDDENRCVIDFTNGEKIICYGKKTQIFNGNLIFIANISE